MDNCCALCRWWEPEDGCCFCKKSRNWLTFHDENDVCEKFAEKVDAG